MGGRGKATGGESRLDLFNTQVGKSLSNIKRKILNLSNGCVEDKRNKDSF